MTDNATKPSRATNMPPEQRRAQLLRAGVACFASKGIGSTKHADLARACQVSVPAVFSYFPNRLAMVSAILEEVGSSIDDPDEDIHDRARVIAASSGFLAKMVFDGVSEKRRQAFVAHILAPLIRG